MRVVRAFAAGLGVGYLIWSGTGRRIVQKVRDAQQRSSSKPDFSARRPSETAAMPADLAVPTSGAEPVFDVTVTAHKPETTNKRRAS